MSFVLAILEYKTAILFYSLVFLIVYINRKKFEVHGKLVYLYRTKIGISFMNFMAEKARRLVKLLGYFGIMIGFIGMIFTFILILSLTYKLLMNEPGAGGASPVIPGLPIAGTGLVFPLITGWIVLFIIILVHEFSHGVVASAYKIKIKNSGLAFFGPILGAFVEPNEKALAKQKDLVQHSVFAAGPFSNFLTVIVAMLIIWALLNPITNILSIPTGVIIYSQPGLPAEKAGIENGTVITGIYGGSVNTVEDFRKAMADIGPNKNIELRSDDNIYPVTTTESPDDPSQGYLGVWIMGEKSELRNDNFLNQILLKIINWFKQLLGWLAFLSLNIGLINLLPIFITDGARMLKIFFERIIPNKGKSMSLWLFFNWASLFSLLILVFLPLLRWLGSILDGVLI
jgi:membrane-associated protease RseP (regulator of RpoE activity)|tara:strand:- start:201 stop:1400 length:1200 start_codon:yes stop_codon:yes gene_type:complete